MDKFFQVPLETSAVGSFMFLTVVKRTVVFHSEKCGVVLDQFQAPYPCLVFHDTEDFVDGEPQRGEVLFVLKAQSGFGERIENARFLKAGCHRFWLLV